MKNAATVEITTPSDVEIVMSRVVNAPRRLVWEAWTRPEYIQQWMLGPDGWSMPVCENDVRAGGSWHFVWRKASGTEMAMRGSYKEVVPPERIVKTEKWGPEWPETINTLTLEEKDGRTTVRESILYPSKAARDAALETGMADGAAQSFDRLEKLLTTLAGR
jgi:uncharacterized protein YndB with AHSA1/START domain